MLHFAHGIIKAVRRVVVPVVILVACSFRCAGQTLATKSERNVPALRITTWEHEIAGGLRFLHAMFPDVDPRSRVVIESPHDWGHTGTLRSEFTIRLCGPDFHGSPTECTLNAYFMMTQPRFGAVPTSIGIIRTAHEKRWRALVPLLISHPEWSAAEIDDAMQNSGMKYGRWNRSGVETLVAGSLQKWEPFFGKLVVDSIRYATYDVGDSVSPRPPLWLIDVHPRGQDKDEVIGFTLSLNTFDGKIESMSIGSITSGPANPH